MDDRVSTTAAARRRTMCLLRHLGIFQFIADAQSPEEMAERMNMSLSYTMEQSQKMLPAGVEAFPEGDMKNVASTMRSLLCRYEFQKVSLSLQERIKYVG